MKIRKIKSEKEKLIQLMYEQFLDLYNLDIEDIKIDKKGNINCIYEDNLKINNFKDIVLN